MKLTKGRFRKLLLQQRQTRKHYTHTNKKKSSGFTMKNEKVYNLKNSTLRKIQKSKDLIL